MRGCGAREEAGEKEARTSARSICWGVLMRILVGKKKRFENMKKIGAGRRRVCKADDDTQRTR